MKALIYTGHPAWKESLNPIIKSRWEQHINEIPEIESFRLYSVYRHESQKDIESQLKDEEILIGFNIDNYLDESFFERLSVILNIFRHLLWDMAILTMML